MYYENSFKNSDSPRKTWNLIKEKIGKNKKLSHPEVLINTNGVEVRKLQDVANMFSDYFAGVGQAIVSAGIDLSPYRSHKEYLPPYECTSIFLAHVSFAEFHKIIKNIKNGNSVKLTWARNMLVHSFWGKYSLCDL